MSESWKKGLALPALECKSWDEEEVEEEAWEIAEECVPDFWSGPWEVKNYCLWSHLGQPTTEVSLCFVQVEKDQYKFTNILVVPGWFLKNAEFFLCRTMVQKAIRTNKKPWKITEMRRKKHRPIGMNCII